MCMGLCLFSFFVSFCVLFSVGALMLFMCELFLVINALHVAHIFSEFQGLYFTLFTGVSPFFIF